MAIRAQHTIGAWDTGGGWEIYVDGIVVLRWREDGPVLVETPRRQFPATTSPHWRVLRMLVERHADVIVSAITDGPSGSGLAKESAGMTPAERLHGLACDADSLALALRELADAVEQP